MQAPSSSIVRVMFASILACVLSTRAHAWQAQPGLQCGGDIENRTWQLWDGFGRGFIRDSILNARLASQGDVYALYDTQTYVQNLADMAARCGRTGRLEEIASIIASTYPQLEQVPGSPDYKGWICKGGRICNQRYRLIGTEVRLDSLQFLVLAVQVANALAHDQSHGEASSPYVDQTLRIAISHLDRWTNGPDPMHVSERLDATPANVKDGQSKLFLTDDDLWMLALEAEVAGTLDALPQSGSSYLVPSVRDRIGSTFRNLTRLLQARTTIRTVYSAQFGNVTVADIDRGFWSRYADSRFAAYTDPTGPVSCTPDGKRVQKPGFNPATVPLDSDIGWDFSHARRFVHAFASLEKNRTALGHVFGVQDSGLPSAQLSSELAATLVTTVWNGDASWPLFSNYWSGANGWYRVAYDNGASGCFAGYGPFGLADSFTTGGFITWQEYQPVIGMLGKRLFDISRSPGADEQAFMRKFYHGLSSAESEANRNLTQLMFWPSLVTPSSN